MRRKKFLFVYALGMAGFLPAMAQLPDVSTADAPKWYYIQVEGSDDGRAGRVFTLLDDSKVAGEKMYTSLVLDELGKQLWRFEKNKAGRYVIINKTSGKQLDAAHDNSVNSVRAVVSDVSAQTFTFTPLSGNYQIVLENAVADGENWFHQGNSGYQWAIITTGSYYGSSENSRFRFVEFEDPNISYSDDEYTTYYALTNASEAFTGRVIREKESDSDVPGAVTLEQTDDQDKYAQWKAVRTDQGLRWVNRATGHALQTDPVPYGLFNVIQASTVVATGNSWIANYLGNGQYTFTATAGDDHITRYLGASPADADEAGQPDEEKLSGSSFAWKLRKIETEITGIDSAAAADEPAFRVVGRTIVGRGLRIHTLGGVAVGAGKELTPGVYLVTASGRTVKVLVK